MQDVSYQEYRKVLDEVEKLRTENNSLKEQLLLMKKQLSRIDSVVDSFIHSIQSSRQ
jgi:cell division septum initiation protein DivIVA